jgi:hypothetical protein
VIPSRFIDYDFAIVPSDQSTGLIEQPPAELLGSFADIPWFDELCAEDMVPRSEWKARAAAIRDDLRATTVEIYSQGRTSACVGFGSAQALETTLTRVYGRSNRVPLSGMDVYSDIGRSLMSGAYIPDGVKRISDIGCLPLRGPETAERYAVTYPGLEYKWRRPSGWGPVAGQFRVTKAAKSQGAEMVASALLKKRCGIVGRSRHCVPYVYLDFNGNSPVAAYANSWARSWGDGGFGYDSERVFGNLVMYVVLEVSFRPSIELPALVS